MRPALARLAMRGLWDGTTYTLPASLKPQTTDAGRLKAAARVLHQRLTVLADGLDRVSTFWPAAEVSRIGHNMIAYAHRGVRGVVLSGAWTVAGKTRLHAADGARPVWTWQALASSSSGSRKTDNFTRSNNARRPARACGSTRIPGFA